MPGGQKIEIKDSVLKEISSFFKTIVREGIILYENELYNDAASRAYYAMHHAAKAALLLKDIDITSHKALISKFGESFIRDPPVSLLSPAIISKPV